MLRPGRQRRGCVNRVVLNDARWVRGDAAYVGDLAAYRIYMINHEDGHALGHEHAHECLPGGLAPVMMQQTFGLRSAATGKLCQANPWPYPPGATGAPGAEQRRTPPQNDEYSHRRLMPAGRAACRCAGTARRGCRGHGAECRAGVLRLTRSRLNSR